MTSSNPLKRVLGRPILHPEEFSYTLTFTPNFLFLPAPGAEIAGGALDSRRLLHEELCIGNA